MRRTEVLQGVRQVMFRGVFDRYASSELNQIEAAELLGISERTFRRWCQRFGEGGEDRLLDRRLGKASGKRVPVDRAAEVECLYRTRYSGFTARHFHEHLVRDHGFPGVTPGPSRSCNRRACLSGRRSEARTGASVPGARFRA